jgi:D-glycerate 3-kinase
MLENIPIRIIEQLLSGDRLNKDDYLVLVADVITNCDRFLSTPSKAYRHKWQKILLSQQRNKSISEDIAFSQSLVLTNAEDLALEIIQIRSQLMRSVYADVLKMLQTQNVPISPSLLLPLLWHYWLPLAQALAKQQNLTNRPFIQGLLGGQGTGKTTLGLILKIILKYLHKSFISISIDDFYKTYVDRQKLRDRRPELIWRGPPSTHDIDLCLQTLQNLQKSNVDVNVNVNVDVDVNAPSKSTNIPRFDKALHNGAGDRCPMPEICQGADIILFEGWFVGMHPLPISAFGNLLPPILSERDRDFALECNAELHNYLPIWQILDSLIVLVPEDYRYCLQWRIEAEHKLIAHSTDDGKGATGMGDQEITEFVEYFSKALHPELFMPPLIQPTINPDCPQVNQYGFPYADWVIKIGRSHLPTAILSITV